jgi:hypothetical protein
MKKQKYQSEELFEFRIKYNAGLEHSAQDSYHYYMSANADQALESHKSTLNKKKASVQDISIEKYNKYSQKWEVEKYF